MAASRDGVPQQHNQFAQSLTTHTSPRSSANAARHGHQNAGNTFGPLPPQARSSLAQGDPLGVAHIGNRQDWESAQLERAELTVNEIEDGDHARALISNRATSFYTVSNLVFFAILGTLARLGLQALTFYPGAPVSFSSLWPNFVGTLVLGFLAEDRMLFRYEWGTPKYDRQLLRAKTNADGRGGGSLSPEGGVTIDLEAAKEAYMAVKKTIPLYIGLSTGFCGCFTSFSAFIRDVFLSLSNDLASPDLGSYTTPRNGGYSLVAALAVSISTISLSLSGLIVGAHLANALEAVVPSLPFVLTRRILDPLVAFLAWGAWTGAVILSVFPPDRFYSLGPSETWRGGVTLSVVFAPLGCLGRFYASLRLNGHAKSFPLGTFLVNVLGVAIFGAAWDIAHVPIGGVVGCQVLQGIEDGFCGCLTTVSTWVAELTALRRRNAYLYGTVSVVAALSLVVAIMGGLRWSQGFSALVCLH